MEVIRLKPLNDDKLLPEFKERLKRDRLGFIFSENCRSAIDALGLTKDKKLDAESVETLWQPLIENAVTFLKMSDPREWKRDYGSPVLEEQRSNLKAFGAEKLKDYFVQFRKFEKVLYGAVRYYHEHTLHVFRVWMLGALLIDDWLQKKKYPYIDFFDALVAPNVERGTDNLITQEEIQAMWCIIALSHDLGYPLQKVDNINDETRAMLRQYAKVNLQDLNFDVPQQHQFINDFILRFISSKTLIPPEIKLESGDLEKIIFPDKERGKNEDLRKAIFRTHVEAKYYLKYSKSLEDFEHGIFSCILLMKSLTYFLESDFDMDALKPLEYEDARQCAIRREILRAIAGHTCEQIYHIRPDTLSFLLILCDELQSWGRPTMEEIMQGEESDLPLSELKKLEEQGVDFEITFGGSQERVYDRTIKLFRRFHKILRAAVDAPQREFSCLIKVKNTGKPIDTVFTFNLESKKGEPPKFNFSINGEMWPIWEDTYDKYWRKKLEALPEQ